MIAEVFEIVLFINIVKMVIPIYWDGEDGT
jgi:hypothetical protein